MHRDIISLPSMSNPYPADKVIVCFEVSMMYACILIKSRADLASAFIHLRIYFILCDFWLRNSKCETMKIIYIFTSVNTKLSLFLDIHKTGLVLLQNSTFLLDIRIRRKSLEFEIFVVRRQVLDLVLDLDEPLLYIKPLAG